MFQKALSPIALILSLILTALIFPGPVSAEPSWQLRAALAWLDSDGRTRQTLPGGERVASDALSDVGFSLTAERRINSRLGIEFGALLLSSPELEVQVHLGPVNVRVRDRLRMELFGAGLNFHLTPDGPVDVYIGPFVGWARLRDLDFFLDGGNASFTVGDELAFGAVLGVDVPFSERWSFVAAARYVALDVEAAGDDGPADPFGLDTLSLGLGVGYRF